MEEPHEPLLIGIDFGTLSGRALVVRASDGKELGSAVHEYPHAVMESRLSAGDGHTPNPDAVEAYNRLHELYVFVHDHFGRDHREIMHTLRALRREAHDKSEENA